MNTQRGSGNRPALRALILGATIGIGLAHPAMAQTVPFEETRPVRPDASVELRVVEHTLVVERWERNEIQLAGVYESEWEELLIGGDEFALRFEIRPDPERRSRSRASSERVVVRVPEGVRITAWTVSGSVQIADLSGSVTAHSVSGSITMEGDVETASLQTVSGSVRYEGDARTLRLSSVSGSVTYRGNSGEARLNSVSGSVLMEGGSEVVDAKSVSGRVNVTSTVPVRSLEAGSVSGAVNFAGRMAAGGTVQLESHSGGVDVTLHPETAARFELSTFSGRIVTEFPGVRDEVRTESRFSPNQSMSFVTGAGTGRVEARSFSGTVRVRAEGE